MFLKLLKAFKFSEGIGIIGMQSQLRDVYLSIKVVICLRPLKDMLN